MLQAIESNQKVKAWIGTIPLENLYTAGPNGEKFFRGLKNGKILAFYCPVCDTYQVPPKLFCEMCFAELTESKEIKPQGELFSFTESWVDVEGQERTEPQVLGFIRFEGVQGGLIHYVNGKSLQLGQKVKAIFRPASQRQGSILDIAYFEAL